MRNTFKSILVLLIFSLFSCDNDEPDEPINTPPTISAQNFSVSEGISDTENIGTVVATDADGDELEFSIKTNSDNLFEISTNGILGLAQGQSLDFETSTTHTLTIEVTDKKDMASAIITINVTDVDENTAPVINEQTFSVSETISDTVDIGSVTATDAEGDTLVFSIAANSGGLFEITTDGTLSLTQGQALDFETDTLHTITVSVSDGKVSSSTAITINVLDEDENTAPAIDEQTFAIDENSAIGTVVGTLIATDAENDDLSFSTTTNDPNFNISAQGEITVARELNFEIKSFELLNIVVSDGSLDDSALLRVNINDVNDAPLFSTVTFSTNAAEDASDDNVIGVVTATDEDNDDLVYSITNDVDDLFELLRSNAGFFKLQTGKSLDFETKTVHTFTVVATDPDGSTGEIDVTLTVVDVDEAQTVTVTRLTGLGGAPAGFVDGDPNTAQFDRPSGLAIATNGDVYVADENNAAIRKIDANNNTSTFATGNGLVKPTDLVFDSNGDLFVADRDAFKIFKITSSGTVTTFAGSTRGLVDGTGTNAQFNRMTGITIDANDNLYVADDGSNRIRKITPSAVVTTVAGDNTRGYADGAIADARFNEARDVAVDANGNIYLADTDNRSIRKITSSGTVTTLAGNGTAGSADGTGAAARFNGIFYITIDANGNLYTADGTGTYKIRKITPDGVVTTLAGSGSPSFRDGSGAPENASFRLPYGIVVSENGRTLYVTEYTSNAIRKIEVTN